MPAKSQAQQKFMGIVHAIQKGDAKPSEFSKDAQQAAKEMKPSDAKDFASTKHAGLPKKVGKESIEAKLKETIRQTYRESLRESVNEAKYPTDLKIGSVILGQGFTRLKGVDGGKYYKIVDMDDSTATLVPSDKSGNVKGSSKVRHKLDSIEGGIKTAKRGDENGIIVIKESVNEGKKVFKVNPGIGSSKYSISSHDGVKTHKDGSDFYDIKIFKNKIDLEKGIKDFKSKGFIEESVIKESVSHEAMGIASMTNTRKEAVQKFIDDNNLDALEILKVVTKGGLVERVRFIQALVGTPGNSSFKWYVKNYANEGVVKESDEPSDIIKDLDKLRNDLIKKVEVLIAKKKKLYSNVDIESPMSADEKQLDKDIQSIFSEIQSIIQQKRKINK